ncbi:MAG: DNA translocase FtsK [Candidatus Competibacteraceae bacterium]|nr:DNA translocase FtsK [Candidatus Competibacteraceae bacterium]
MFGGIAIYLLMALLTFRAADPAWTHTAPGVVVTNMSGVAGAWFADITFYFFGILAYAFPVGVAFCGWRLCRPGTLQNPDAEIILFRLFGFLVILGSGCGLAELLFNTATVHPHASAGGILGSFLAAWLGNAFNVIGITLFLFVLFAAGFTLATGLSWLDLLDAVGTVTLNLFNGASKLLTGLRSWLEAEDNASQTATETTAEPIAEPDLSSPIPVPQPAQAEAFNPFSESPPAVAPTPAKATPKLTKAAPLRTGKRQRIEPIMNYATEELDANAGEEPPFSALSVPTNSKPEADEKTPIPSMASPYDSESVPIKLSDVAPVYQAGQLSVLLASSVYQANTAPNPLILGEVADEYPLVIDLARLPHMLIVGADDAAVTALLHVVLLSLLYKASPQQLQLLMLDNEDGTLAAYAGLPQLLTPMTNRVDQTVNALVWCKKEIERRRQLLVAADVPDIVAYNHRSTSQDDKVHTESLKQAEPSSAALPLIAVFVSELADIVDAMGDWVEGVFAKLAAEGPSVGLHLILASRRPSSEVLTTLLKAHIPARLVSKVATAADSRLVLNRDDAEVLADDELLYLPPGADTPKRLRTIRVEDSEIQRVTDYWKQNPSAMTQQ